MQHSVVVFSEVDIGDRIDAEYFQPTYLDIEEQLAQLQARPLKGYCSITGSAFYPAATHLYEIGEIPFIRCVDCISFPLITSRQDSLFEKIPLDFADEHKNIKRLSKGDIVITKVGTPCYASVVHDLDDVALSRTVLGLKSIKNIDPYFLVAFLRSKYGFLQLFRERELTIQFQLTLERVGRILVYKPLLHKLENEVSSCFKLHEDLMGQAETLYNNAQSLLLSELGLADWQPRHRLTFVKGFADTQRAGRIDAEYFQPKYADIVDAIERYPGGWDTLGQLVSIRKCVEVGSKKYREEGVPFVRVSNLTPFEITEEKYISEDLYAEIKQHQPKQGEILFSKDGTPGIAHYLREQPKKMIPSGGILRLGMKTDKVAGEYLALVLNSTLTQEQASRDGGGSVILHWRPDQIKDVTIPILSDDKQAQIHSHVSESFHLREQSKHLLDCAKRAVEIAIEQDEQAAIEWLRSETQLQEDSHVYNGTNLPRLLVPADTLYAIRFPETRWDLVRPVVEAMVALGGTASRQEIISQVIEKLGLPPYTDDSYWEGLASAYRAPKRKRKDLFENRLDSALQIWSNQGRIKSQGGRWHLQS